MTAEDQVLQTDDRRFAAMRNEDWAAFDAVLADELTYCHSTARLETKAEHMANLKARKPRYIDAVPRDRKARVHGDVGLVNGICAIHVNNDGKVSMLEAFNFAHANSLAFNQMHNFDETPLLDADGDGVGRNNPGINDSDGSVARYIFL